MIEFGVQLTNKLTHKLRSAYLVYSHGPRIRIRRSKASAECVFILPEEAGQEDDHAAPPRSRRRHPQEHPRQRRHPAPPLVIFIIIILIVPQWQQG